MYWHQYLCVTQSLLSSKNTHLWTVVLSDSVWCRCCSALINTSDFVQSKNSVRGSPIFLLFQAFYTSHPLKIVYYISFSAPLMSPYFTKPPFTIAFSLLSQLTTIFLNPYIWKDVMLLQNKTVLRLKATFISPFLPYRTKNEVSGMLKQKNSRCNTEADMFDILIMSTVGSH
jgi:hypothetical protein